MRAADTPPLRDSEVITAGEVRPHHATAYDVVASLRPHFLRTLRTASAPPEEAGDIGERPARSQRGDAVSPTVYLDGVRLGPAVHLRWIRASEIVEIRHLNTVDAGILLGLGHEAGAVLVVTRRR